MSVIGCHIEVTAMVRSPVQTDCGVLERDPSNLIEEA